MSRPRPARPTSAPNVPSSRRSRGAARETGWPPSAEGGHQPWPNHPTGPNHRNPDPAEPNDTKPNDTGPNDTGPNDTGPNDTVPGCVAASDSDENRPGLLFISDV
jgi:hypothetical protein